MAGERGLKAVRGATVQLWDAEREQALGQGLLLSLAGEGAVVLTCHHVIAAVEPAAVRVRRPEADGELGPPVAARLDEDASDPTADAVVLRPDAVGWEVRNPLLHALDPSNYNGSMSATGLTWLRTDNFGARLETATHRLVVSVPHPPGRYELPVAFRLKDPSDAQPGISGGVVLCENGVVGLVHFARRESAAQARQAYVNPITAWTGRLPTLAPLIEPFVDARLRKRADVIPAEQISPHCGLLAIPGYRDDVYVPRPVDERAIDEFEHKGAVMLVGSHLSGKTRLTYELVHRHPGSLVVVPRGLHPPNELSDDSSFADREVVLLFENMHVNPGIKPLEWWDRFQGSCERATVIATSRDERDWAAVEQRQRTFLGSLAGDRVEIDELDEEQGWELARKLGLTREQFEARFDGTPGSLLVEPERAAAGGPALPNGAAAGTAVEAAGAGRSSRVPHNLPQFTSTFVGREEETERVRELLSGNAVVTLTGPDGRGKTRLSMHVAQLVLDEFPDGVWFVDLSTYAEGALVAAAVATTLGLHERASASAAERLVEHLLQARTLVVLNGVDDVTGACARLVADLVGACAEVKVLSTGREALGIEGEAVYVVPPLAVPDGAEGNGESAAVRLFRERAGRYLDTDDLSEEERTRIAAICRRLNGNPLAIELAAAHLADAPVRQLDAELKSEELPSPAEHPEAAAATRVDATLDRALDGLEPEEERLFSRLGVFAGSWSLEAVVAVAGEGGLDPERIPDLVRRLVDRSLLLIEGRAQGQDRFRISDSLRRRAQARLEASPDSAAVRRRHAEYYASLAEQAKGKLAGRHAGEWLDELEREQDNCRSALSWALHAGDVAVGLRLGAALWSAWYQRSRLREGRQWLEELLDQAPSDDEVLADRAQAAQLAEVLNGAGNLALNQADYAAAEEWHARSLAIRRALGEEAQTAGSLNNLGLVARRRGDFGRARRLFEDAIAISRRHTDPYWEAIHLNHLANAVREGGGELDLAAELQEESVMLFTRIGVEWGIAMSLCDLGYVYLDRRDTDTAGPHLRLSLELRERLGRTQGLAESLNGLGHLERLRDRLSAAGDHHLRALEIFDEIGDRLRAAESLEGLAIVAALSGRPTPAARLSGAALAVRQLAGAPLPPATAEANEAWQRRARDELGRAEFRRRVEEGRQLSLREAVGEAATATG